MSRNDNVMLDRPVVIDVIDSAGQTGECVYMCMHGMFKTLSFVSTEQQMVFVENGAQHFQFNVTLQDNEIAIKGN